MTSLCKGITETALILGRVSKLTHGGFTLEAHLKHVIVFCGEGKFPFSGIFL